MTELATQIHQNPPLLIFLLFACYLLGSVFRALPVNWAERSIPPFRVEFPYPDFVTEVIKELSDHKCFSRHDPQMMTVKGQRLPMDVFNYWKDVLCLQSARGFEYFLTFETRVRLFAGIIWAAWVGVASGLLIVIRSWDLTNRVALPLLILSFVLLATFATNFHRVRRQEVRALVLLFIAHSHTPKTAFSYLADGKGQGQPDSLE